MKRVLVTGAAVVLLSAVTAGPASAAAQRNDNNCYGSGQSGAVSGPGGLPGSKVSPAPGFEDPENGGPTWNGPVTSYFAQQPATGTGGNVVSEFQQSSREANANCGNTGAP